MTRLLFLLALTQSAHLSAGPRIEWSYYNKPKGCWHDCYFKILGKCVPKATHCDYRTADFTDFHQGIVQNAMNKLSQRLREPRVHSCIFNHRRHSFGVSAQDAHLDFTAISSSAWLPRLHLHAYRESTQFTGRAYQQRVVRHVNGQYLEWSNEPHIDLNLSAMEESSRNLGLNAASDSLAGTIIHEFLHQMGHGHPNGYEDGNYVTVVGDCIASNGAGARSRGFNLHGNIGRLFTYSPR